MRQANFNDFLEALGDYLYKQGWYVNGQYIKQKCKTYKEVEDYLEEHCYSRPKSKQIVEQFRQKVLEQL